MAKKDSGKVTITLDRTTVAQLRGEKGGVAWDVFMLNLIEGMKQGVRARCMVCRKVVVSEDVDLTASMMVKKLGWREISINGGLNIIGFMCDKCRSEMKEKER